MTKSDQIRALITSGRSVSEIASDVGVRYQFAHNVLKRADLLPKKSDAIDRPTETVKAKKKPALLACNLTDGGFRLTSRWVLSQEGELELDLALPKEMGVYAFVTEGMAQYVGVATMGLAKRIYFYRKPGKTQRTSLRINNTLKDLLRNDVKITVYTASPPNLEWNGLPVHGCAGLELGMIKKYSLPWNMRSAG